MGVLRSIIVVISLGVTVAALALATLTVRRMVRLIRTGAADPTRTDQKGQRWRTMLRETLGHTRMMRWTASGVAHWFVFFAFGALVLTLVAAYGEIFDPAYELPIIDGWAPWGLFVEVVAATCLVGILVLIGIRQRAHPKNAAARSRFAGSTMWQGYYVEWTIVAIMVCIFLIRGFRVATDHFDYPRALTPVSHLVGSALPDSEDAISVVAGVKIIVSMAWFIVIALNITMGVAWHRFTAFFNIWFRRDADGAPALGGLRPLLSDGKPLDFEDADPDRDRFGVGNVEEFSWKGLLDFTTCTECGRCQSQCPAWNTAKPLSPKLLVTTLRDNAYAKAPYLLAGGGKTPAGQEKAEPRALLNLPLQSHAELERPLIGDASANGVIDPDVLWGCTTCGACVEQCPVDIEHVDHIVDMRRYQVLVESNLPPEAAAMLRNLENKGNPWGASPATRLDWTKGLSFSVDIVTPGEPIAEDVEYLFWVGCAGAFDDRARGTTRAVAELLHTAGVRFVVLGKGETCTGDPARRVGNEFVFQTLAKENVATLGTAFAKRLDRARRAVVASCPHCFNTLANEYPQLGGEYDVVHHTQLLQRLVNEGRLRPTTPLDSNVTYHDPCYLGRHNRVFTPPRELLGSLPGVNTAEMPRHAERSFCCGAGGGRMWMEEKIGKRINVERTEEAMALKPDVVAVGCPFCSTMLNDGVQAKQGDGSVPEHVEVADIATLLHRSVNGNGAQGDEH